MKETNRYFQAKTLQSYTFRVRVMGKVEMI